jgi:hypothetical protein
LLAGGGRNEPFHTVADGHLAVRNTVFSPGRDHRSPYTSPQVSPKHGQRNHSHFHRFHCNAGNADDADKDEHRELDEDVYVVEHRPTLPKPKKAILRYTTSVDSISACASPTSLCRGEHSPGHSRATSPGVSPRFSQANPPYFDDTWNIPYDDDEIEPRSMEDGMRSLAKATKLLKLCLDSDACRPKVGGVQPARSMRLHCRVMDNAVCYCCIPGPAVRV